MFSNSPDRTGDYTINFFNQNAAGVQAAQLACPFFSNNEPLEILAKAGCREIRLLIRLCSFTSPVALTAARSIPGVHIRFFTSETFHAKFYILDSVALIGSANLTGSGLNSNRELSILIRNDDFRFDGVPAFFEELWSRASVLTEVAFERFSSWHRTSRPPASSDHIDGIDDSSPQTVNVGTRSVTRERAYLESFRREYYETLIPAYKKVIEIYSSNRKRHPLFESFSFNYEIDRFLSWAKLEFTTDERLHENPIRGGDDLDQNIHRNINLWFDKREKVDEQRVSRLSNLQRIFSNRENLNNVSFDELADSLIGCAAFDEQMRFTKGGRVPMVEEFKKDNRPERVLKNFTHLAFGDEEFVKRTYDCIYLNDYRLRPFWSKLRPRTIWLDK